MRMWMLEPKILCRQHLLGEHNELHTLAGTIRAGRSLRGWLLGGDIDPASMYVRHQELVAEMLERGYNHHSPMPELVLPDYKANVDVAYNLEDLLSRCFRCRERYNDNLSSLQWPTPGIQTV